MQTYSITSPQMNVRPDSQKAHLVHLGPARRTDNILTAQSYQLGPSTMTQSSWTLSPPSLSTVVDRYMQVRYYFDIVTDQDMQRGISDSLRQFPASSIIDTTTVTINGESFSDNTQAKLHAMACYGNDAQDRDKSWSKTAAQPDQYQQYSDWQTLGSARNVAAYYGENSAEMSRGGFEFEVIGPRQVRCVVTEPLFLSPFFNGVGHQVEGMVNVNEITINLRHSANVSRVFSHSTAGNAITAVTTTFYRAPELLSTFYTPDLTQRLPELQVLPYSKSNDYIRSMAQIPVAGSLTVFSDTIRLSQIPRYVYLFARRTTPSSTFSTCDSFPSIEGVSIQWGNESGLLSSATKQDLYEISRRNGCNLSYPQFSKYRGSVLCLEMGKDIGLQDFEAPGLNGGYTLQAQITFKNQASAPIDCDFYLVTVNQGTFSIAPNSARATLGGVTAEQVMKARTSPELPHVEYERLHGSGFFSSLKNIIHKVAGIAAPVLGAIAPEFAPIASAVHSATGGSMNTGGGLVSGGSVRRR